MEISAARIYSSSLDRVSDYVRKNDAVGSRPNSSKRSINDTVTLSQEARDYLDKLSRKEILEAQVNYAEDGTNAAYSTHLASKNLAASNFANSYLQGADFSYSNLRSANFRNADLRGADFTGADLFATDLTGANLEGATMTRAQFASAQTDKVTKFPNYNILV